MVPSFLFHQPLVSDYRSSHVFPDQPIKEAILEAIHVYHSNREPFLLKVKLTLVLVTTDRRYLPCSPPHNERDKPFWLHFHFSSRIWLVLTETDFLLTKRCHVGSSDC